MSLTDFGGIAPNIALKDEADLAAGGWAADARAALASAGAVLLRGPISRPDGAEVALAALDDQLLDDAFWSTPRSKVKGKTLTATEYPSPRVIPLHTEMAYMSSWPRFIAFHSIQAAPEGGETTICDIERVSADLGPRLKPFHDKGVTYRRTFQKGLDVAWRQAFQTEKREDVEKVARRHGMKLRWLDDDTLQTSHTAQGAVTAEDGRILYFNQSHLFHPSALEPNVRSALEKTLGDRLPRNATYGDGSPIADADLDAVRGAFEAHQTGMRWRDGDILILDNMRFAHGRMPFSGPRRLHVSLARLVETPRRTPLFGPAAEEPKRRSFLDRLGGRRA